MAIIVSAVRALLVDDHPVVREGLRSVLGADPSIDMVGEASTAEQALEAIETRAPDVILLDIQLPTISGLDLLREIKRRHRDLPVVILTMHDSESYCLEAIHAGASGYILKGAPFELIPLALKAAVAGGCLIGRRLLENAVKRVSDPSLRQRDPERDRILSQLTPRELDVLRLLAKGLQNRAMSAELHLAEVTIKKHVQSVVSKLGMPDRMRAALLAARLGLEN